MVYLFRFLVAIFMIMVAVFIRPILLLLRELLWYLKLHELKYYWSYNGDFFYNNKGFWDDFIYFIKYGSDC